MNEGKTNNNLFGEFRKLLIIPFVISIILPFFAAIFLPPLYLYIWLAILISFICFILLIVTTIFLSVGSKTLVGRFSYPLIAIISVIIFFSSMGILIDTRNYVYISRNEEELVFLVDQVRKSGAVDISLMEGDSLQYIDIKENLRKQSIQDAKMVNDSCIFFQQGEFLSEGGICYCSSDVKPKKYGSQTITKWFHMKDNWYSWGI